MSDSVAQYIVNLDDIEIMFDRLKGGYDIYSEKWSPFFFSAEIKIKKGRNVFFLPIQKEAGNIKDFSIIKKNEGFLDINISISEKPFIQKPIGKGRVKICLPTSRDFEEDVLKFECIASEEDVVQISFFGQTDVIQTSLESNCSLNFYINNALIESFEFTVPFGSSYSFIAPLQYKGTTYLYSNRKQIQTFDRYGFNISERELGTKMEFNFFYGGAY